MFVTKRGLLRVPSICHAELFSASPFPPHRHSELVSESHLLSLRGRFVPVAISSLAINKATL